MPDTDALAKLLVQGWYVQWRPSVHRENDPHGYDALVSEIAAALSAARAEAEQDQRLIFNYKAAIVDLRQQLSAARAEAIEACERVAQAELDADKAQVTPLRSNANFIKCGQVGAASRILAAIRTLAAGQGGENG